jgi:hypothetical protein
MMRPARTSGRRLLCSEQPPLSPINAGVGIGLNVENTPVDTLPQSRSPTGHLRVKLPVRWRAMLQPRQGCATIRLETSSAQACTVNTAAS